MLLKLIWGSYFYRSHNQIKMIQIQHQLRNKIGKNSVKCREELNIAPLLLSSVSNMSTCLNNFFHSGYIESVSGQDMYLCIHIRGYTIECWGIGASLFNEKSIRIPLGNGSG